MNGYNRRPVPNGNSSSAGGSRDMSASAREEVYERAMRNLPSPRADSVLDGYRQDILNDFDAPNANYTNPLNPARTQSSALLNLNDSVQVHLLVEMALSDSKEFVIFSQEEVDELKKMCKSLTARIEQTRQNLAVQSKYRDAAVSMSRLYNAGDKRRSLLGGNRASDQLKEADQERVASERKCEQLAQELWQLEKRLMEPQRRLLEHTAGVLQMTHKGPKRVPEAYKNAQPGIPGSPESMYTYSNRRSSVEPVPEANFFDERSLYSSADRLLEGLSSGRNSLDRVRPSTSGKSEEHIKAITQTAQKLEELNNKLREVMIKANPDREDAHMQPPQLPAEKNMDGKALLPHLDFLERGIQIIDEEQQRTSLRHEEEEMAMEEEVEQINREIRGLLLPYDPSLPQPPELTGQSLREQLTFFQNSIGTIESELERTAAASTKASANQDDLEQVETVLMGLWDIIQSGEEELRQQKLQRRQLRQQNGQEDSDMSDDDGMRSPSPFSLSGFSAKVQDLYAQATSLKEQKKVLQRQIKQQRELNSKSDATKDAELTSKTEKLRRVQNLLERTEADADTLREQLSSALSELETKEQDGATELLTVRNALAEKQSQIATLQRSLSTAQEEHEKHKTDLSKQIASIEGLLAQASEARQATEKKQEDARKELEEKEQELERTNMEVARLQTEVTIARAELDGAYGTRAQRAAEVAANPAIQREIDSLTSANQALKVECESLRNLARQKDSNEEEKQKTEVLRRELREMMAEYEEMTKASVEWEREREELERVVDRLRDEREAVEQQLADERVRGLGMGIGMEMRSPAGDRGSATSPGERVGTSTRVLREEFKKMMRDTRAEGVRALRAEQAERRRLEEELRALKRMQGPGKSSLSQSIGIS